MERKKRRRPKDDLLTFERGDLGYPGAAVIHREQQRMVTPTHPARLVGCCNEGVALRPRSIPNELLIFTLDGDRQDPRDHRNTLGITEGHKAEKRAQGGQADVAGADGVASWLLQVVEKGEEGRGV